MSALIKKPYSFVPTTLEEAEKFALKIANSSFCPKDYRGKADDVFIAVQMGSELGLAPLQSLQNIAVINGRPSIWGDAMLALVMAHPEFVSIDEYKKDDVAYCVVKRKGMEPQTRTFSKEMAKRAGLLGKSGPWQQYEDRMMQLRARGFALRDVFPDALKGIVSAEEAMDIIDVEGSSTVILERPKKGIEALESNLGIQKEEVIDSETGEITPPVIEEPKGKITKKIVLDMLNRTNNLEALKAVELAAAKLDDEDKKAIKLSYQIKREELRKNAEPKSEPKQEDDLGWSEVLAEEVK